MFEVFQPNFPPDLDRISESDGAAVRSGVPGLSELIGRFGGASFRRGLYRVIRATDLDEWTARVALGFPGFEGRITCFGYDWLGRAFAVDTRRLERGQPGIVMFEPGTGEALEIPSNLQDFHDDGLIEFGDAALAIDFHQRWLASGGAAPGYAQCVGYKRPLFLGGADKLENLELSDLDVYWHLMGQLIAKSKGLPRGAPVRISIG
jgi:Domain of unknown function (DUF1851)